MKRDLAAMANKSYDVVVVGGGITGACVARDAALRGLSVALLDKNDFASATTAASSKLIHGGLRYLQNLEIGIVRESLRERRIWSNVAPHLVDPMTFLMPIRTDTGLKDRWVKAIGLTLYDWLSYDRNRIEDPEKAIPAHKKLSREEVLALEPGLVSDELRGAQIFYDYQMYSPERLALECILSAVEHGADVANYAEVVGFTKQDERVTGVELRDLAPALGASDEDAPPGETWRLAGRVVVNAAGPWADLLMTAIHRNQQDHVDLAAPRLIRSKGIHLLTRGLTKSHAIAVTEESTHFFILPWRGHSLLGTTDTVYEGDPDKVHVSEKDIVDFLAVVNKGYPGAQLRRSDVLHFYAGLRPIMDTTSPEPKGEEERPDQAPAEGEEGPSKSYWASRGAEVYDHEVKEGIKGVVTAIGGKWTTSRHLAEQVVNMVAGKLGIEDATCRTVETPTYGGNVGRFAEFSKEMLQKYPDLQPQLVEHLAKNYGTRIAEVTALGQENPDWLKPLSQRFPDVSAQVVYAVRNEMALTVEDVLFRRTGLGTLGTPGDDVIARVSDLMAQQLNWDAAARAAHDVRAVAKFVSWARTLAVVNPHSWGDRTGVIWPDIEDKLRRAIGPVKAVFTDAPMAGERLTRQALKDGMEQIIAVGGDGTINEVINGFFDNGQLVNPEAVVAVLTSGTGADFRRTFGMCDDLDEQIDRLAVSEIRPIDLGKLTYTRHNGREAHRYFNNIASFGLSGATARAVNRLTFGKKFGGRFAFQWGMLKALLTYRNRPVRIQVDDHFNDILHVSTAAVCNGQFFGSGMHMAPNARPDDGLFDVVIVHDLGPIDLIRGMKPLYRGEHLHDDHVTVVQGKRVVARPAGGPDEILLDVDGEAPGRLPATFEILPEAVYFRS